MNKFQKEWVYFWTAMMFFTRIPIPFRIPYSTEIMNQSQKYFAWVGLFTGAVNALVFFTSSLLFPVEIAVVLSMTAGILLTGAFHEDGFTDVCDSFGGGYGKEKILTIMKDSRIGAYGAIGIVLLVLLKFLTLTQIGRTSVHLAGFTIIAGHAISRYLASTMLYTHQYVTDTDVSKSKPMAQAALPLYTLFVGLSAVLLPFIIFGEWRYMSAILIACTGRIYMAWYFQKHIGGYTGDCLGAIQQVTEVLWYMGIILVWKFI